MNSESTEEEIERIIGDWHSGNIPDKSLHEALGWTWEQYAEWVRSQKLPNNQ